MQFLRGNIDDFQVEKDHFQKSDIFTVSKRGVLREITSSAQRNHIAPWDPSENHANTIGKRDVFGNGVVAGTFLRFRALKTVEIHCFLSSPTWNQTAKSIKPSSASHPPFHCQLPAIG